VISQGYFSAENSQLIGLGVRVRFGRLVRVAPPASSRANQPLKRRFSGNSEGQLLAPSSNSPKWKAAVQGDGGVSGGLLAYCSLTPADWPPAVLADDRLLPRPGPMKLQ